jgi:arsenite methyltransferase
MLRFIARQFRKPTGFLGRVISLIMIRGNKPAYDKLIPLLDIRQQDKVLEIGYGHGLGVGKISNGYDCTVTGIDFSELMYREALKRNRRKIEQGRVRLYLGDFLTWDAGPGYFDKIFCINVIYFWDNLDEPFTKMYRLLRIEGVLCIFMVHLDDLTKIKFTKNDVFNKYTVDMVVEGLKRSGFRDIVRKFEHGVVISCRK